MPVFLAYGDLKLKVAVATLDGEGHDLTPEAQLLVRKTLDRLADQASNMSPSWTPASGPTAVTVGRRLGRLELVRREGMKAGPLIVPASPLELSIRLIAIARAPMLIQLNTGDLPPDEASIMAGETIAFDIDLLRQAGGVGRFLPVPLVSGDGPVFHVGDRVHWSSPTRGGSMRTSRSSKSTRTRTSSRYSRASRAGSRTASSPRTRSRGVTSLFTRYGRK